MRYRFPAKALVCAVLGLFFLTGCEDPEARMSASKAEKELASVKDQLAQVQAKQTEIESKIDQLHGQLTNKIEEGTDKLDKKVVEIQKDLLEKLGTRTTEIAKQLNARVDEVNGNFDKRLNSVVSVEIPEKLSGLRKEVDQMRVDLIGFMDKQLKELYPYAYQPKRMDPLVPPDMPQPDKE